MNRPRVSTVFALALGSAVFGTTVVAAGQDDEGMGREEAAAPEVEDEADADAPPVDADAEEVGEGEEKVKVFRFTGLDISGRLKSPSILYFLNRLRAEFDRPRLPHRSFVPELVRSSKGKSFKPRGEAAQGPSSERVQEPNRESSEE